MKNSTVSPQDPLRSIDFPTFVLSVSSAAFMGMGLAPRDEKSSPDVNLELARQNIDLLAMIQEKTIGNLTPDEDRLVQGLLYELRMKFVEISSKHK